MRFVLTEFHHVSALRGSIFLSCKMEFHNRRVHVIKQLGNIQFTMAAIAVLSGPPGSVCFIKNFVLTVFVIMRLHCIWFTYISLYEALYEAKAVP